MNLSLTCPKSASEYCYEDNNQYICPECGYEWIKDTHTVNDDVRVVRAANGNELQDGDSVTVIKDLTAKSSSLVVKVGAQAKNFRLVEGDHDIDCKIDRIGALPWKPEFVKKPNGFNWRVVEC